MLIHAVCLIDTHETNGISISHIIIAEKQLFLRLSGADFQSLSQSNGFSYLRLKLFLRAFTCVFVPLKLYRHYPGASCPREPHHQAVLLFPGVRVEEQGDSAPHGHQHAGLPV